MSFTGSYLKATGPDLLHAGCNHEDATEGEQRFGLIYEEDTVKQV